MGRRWEELTPCGAGREGRWSTCVRLVLRDPLRACWLMLS